MDQLLENVTNYIPELIAIRREIHEHPELQFEEHLTSERIQQDLRGLDISFVAGRGRKDPNSKGTGIVASLGSGRAPCVALRADMDALPVTEETGLDFASKTIGCMHACGHDLHVAMLLGAARLLKKEETKLQGTVRLVFQPAEEGGGGAKYMIDEGVLSEAPPVESIFGLHVNPLAPVGELWSRPGPLLAASCVFDVNIKGVGGHAAMPFLTRDPVTVAATIVQNINTYAARNFSFGHVEHAGVISITAINTPTSYNVIPPHAKLCGTIRALTDVQAQALRKVLQKICVDSAGMYGLTAVVEFQQMAYPVTYNDESLYEWADKTLKSDAIPKSGIVATSSVMGGEDFSFYSQHCKALFMFIGAAREGSARQSLHCPDVVFNEEVLKYGSTVLAYLAMERLKKLKL